MRGQSPFPCLQILVSIFSRSPPLGHLSELHRLGPLPHSQHCVSRGPVPRSGLARGSTYPQGVQDAVQGSRLPSPFLPRTVPPLPSLGSQQRPAKTPNDTFACVFVRHHLRFYPPTRQGLSIEDVLRSLLRSFAGRTGAKETRSKAEFDG
ncbi:hypothetical protein FA13DRAFT_1414528 [Coprinellus micaceus]|uniref:Uncharacterized protein n=1 Tax=Coprinellus micaceus TaxID=71717 RepID=A0A4Y7SNN3_COPMI|nr:hypothetical protein FA13DRAFT_1414528 [Coprinellus micaceus]